MGRGAIVCSDRKLFGLEYTHDVLALSKDSSLDDRVGSFCICFTFSNSKMVLLDWLDWHKTEFFYPRDQVSKVDGYGYLYIWVFHMVVVYRKKCLRAYKRLNWHSLPWHPVVVQKSCVHSNTSEVNTALRFRNMTGQNRKYAENFSGWTPFYSWCW